MRVDPHSTPRSLGYCYIKAKDYPAALRALTRSSQLEPDNGEAWNNLAAIHMHQGHWRQAYNALSGAWELRPRWTCVSSGLVWRVRREARRGG